MAVEEKALAVIDAEYREYVPSVVVTPEEVKRNVQRLERVIKEVMREGIDYDTLPGTPKPSLLKPGAERLLQFFGFGHKVTCVDKIEDWQGGFFYYRYKAQIIKTHRLPDGTIYEQVVAECEGSANSKEAKYRWRWVPEFKLPASVDRKATHSEERRGKDGKSYRWYRLENDDPYSVVNTLQKMGIKRALVGATLQATGTSNMFTQDLEDMPETYVEAIAEDRADEPKEQKAVPKSASKPPEGGNGKDKDKVRQAWCERIYADAHKRNIDDNMVKLIAGVEVLGREEAVESLYELTPEQLQKLHERVKTKGQVA